MGDAASGSECAGSATPQGWEQSSDFSGWTAKDTERFWSKVDRSGGQDACWLWLARITKEGYGHFHFSGRTMLAHRISMGASQSPLVIDHRCRVRSCVNPKHLELVTVRENCARGTYGAYATHCKHGHEFTKENTYVWRGRQRVCRVCNRRRVAQSKARRGIAEARANASYKELK